VGFTLPHRTPRRPLDLRSIMDSQSIQVTSSHIQPHQVTSSHGRVCLWNLGTRRGARPPARVAHSYSNPQAEVTNGRKDQSEHAAMGSFFCTSSSSPSPNLLDAHRRLFHFTMGRVLALVKLKELSAARTPTAHRFQTVTERWSHPRRQDARPGDPFHFYPWAPKFAREHCGSA